jgi:hypothetical protein
MKPTTTHHSHQYMNQTQNYQSSEGYYVSLK